MSITKVIEIRRHSAVAAEIRRNTVSIISYLSLKLSTPKTPKDHKKKDVISAQWIGVQTWGSNMRFIACEKSGGFVTFRDSQPSMAKSGLRFYLAASMRQTFGSMIWHLLHRQSQQPVQIIDKLKSFSGQLKCSNHGTPQGQCRQGCRPVDFQP